MIIILKVVCYYLTNNKLFWFKIKDKWVSCIWTLCKLNILKLCTMIWFLIWIFVSKIELFLQFPLIKELKYGHIRILSILIYFLKIERLNILVMTWLTTVFHLKYLKKKLKQRKKKFHLISQTVTSLLNCQKVRI